MTNDFVPTGTKCSVLEEESLSFDYQYTMFDIKTDRKKKQGDCIIKKIVDWTSFDAVEEITATTILVNKKKKLMLEEKQTERADRCRMLAEHAGIKLSLYLQVAEIYKDKNRQLVILIQASKREKERDGKDCRRSLTQIPGD